MTKRKITLKGIDAAILLVRTSGQAFNELVHNTACDIIQHAQATGDCTRALALVEAMPKSTKRGAVIEWFADYSPIGMNVKERKVRFQKPDAKAYRPFDLPKARANPWYERDSVKKEDLPDTTLEAVNKSIFALVTKFQKQIDNGDVAANDREAVQSRVDDLKALASKAYRAAKKPAVVREEGIAA